MVQRAVIIVAGGKGTRMGVSLPKQFLPVCGRPVLMRTIDRFRHFDAGMHIVLALPAEEQGQWAALCERHAFPSPVVVDGGETRFHSVRNALAAVPQSVGLIGVHDGVRPFVSRKVIGECYAEAARSGAAIPVTSVLETLRHVPEGDASGITVPRGDYRLVQTPQVFRADWLRAAYAQPFSEQFTDDASVVEAAGHRVSLVPGNRENIKLTVPFDLVLAEALCHAGPPHE